MRITHAEQAQELAELRLMQQEARQALAQLLALSRGDDDAADEPVEPEVTEPEPESTEDQHRERNLKIAEFCAEIGVVPAGQALAAIHEGTRDHETLRRLNAADGITSGDVESAAVDTEGPPRTIDDLDPTVVAALRADGVTDQMIKDAYKL